MPRSHPGVTVVLLASAFAAACGGAPTPATMPLPDAGVRGQTVEQQSAQVLNRLAFGPRPGEVDEVMRYGVDRWIDRQLHPETIPDSNLDVVLHELPAWSTPVEILAAANPPQDLFLRDLRRVRGLAVNAPIQLTGVDSIAFKAINDRTNQLANQMLAAKVVRAQMSERQLLEVMTDFWENHFSVFAGKMPTRFTLLEWDRDVIRPHALGKFRDLLGAVAHSPAMLWYLDNWQSGCDANHLTLPEYTVWRRTGRRPPNRRQAGLNENYGRELLELHTLGVDGGYTQQDVINVARALTGWTIDRPRDGGGFVFRPGAHDAEAKVVLGHHLPAGRGEADGEEVLDIIARHPATAHFIALKLARRFVSDTPSAALVDRAAETFRRTDGDIREVVRTIMTSGEFFSLRAYRSKVKSPFELVVSARRIMNASPDTSARSAYVIARLGEPLFGHLAPNGWPETGDAWINTGSLLDRINFGMQVGAGRLPFAAVEQWPPWALVSSMPFERQVDAVVREVLAGDASDETRRVMMAGSNPLVSATAATPGAAAGGAAGARPTLRDLLGLALGSPEFQRR